MEPITKTSPQRVALNVIQPVKIPSLDGIEEFRRALLELNIDLPTDDRILTLREGSPLAKPIKVGRFFVGNRFACQPMEGWDGTEDGRTTEHVKRRWRRFFESGAKLIWCEATAVDRDFRANPFQLCFGGDNYLELGKLLKESKEAHIRRFGTADDLLVGIQLTHSGRFCKPNDNKRFKPKITYHHPLLDKKFGIKPDDDSVLITDREVEELIELYIKAAKQAHEAGFQFVDVKACHGYLLHEFLSAFNRPGPYGGESLENRSRILCEIIRRIKKEVPDLMIGVRLSAFDFPPFKPDPARGKGDKLGPGIPEDFSGCLPYPIFGANRNNPLEIDLSEPIELIWKLKYFGVEIMNITAGSPYYCPHIQRPALFPPSDGYQPPEDPLIGVTRQIHVARELKEYFSDLVMVGTAYTYLQEFFPHVAQAVVRERWTDFVGLGRALLSYPEMPQDILEKGKLDHKGLCRTFSDCTTAPRNGLLSGCFPLDDYYANLSDAEKLQIAKEAQRQKVRDQNQAAQAQLLAATKP